MDDGTVCRVLGHNNGGEWVAHFVGIDTAIIACDNTERPNGENVAKAQPGGAITYE